MEESKPMVMISNKQKEQLKKLGMWREPIIRHPDWPENEVKEAFRKAVKELKKD